VILIETEIIQGCMLGIEFLEDEELGLDFIAIDLFIIRFYIYKGIRDETRSSG